jgi:hypothetical protein
LGFIASTWVSSAKLRCRRINLGFIGLTCYCRTICRLELRKASMPAAASEPSLGPRPPAANPPPGPPPPAPSPLTPPANAHILLSADAACQGLTLVHFSAQRKHFLWDRGCVQRLSRGV